MLALTGTADKQTQNVISSSLVLKPNTYKIFISPNRKNLRITVINTTKKDALSKLNWLIELCKSKGLETPKTILFCNTMKDVATLVNYIMWKLGTSAFSPQDSRKPDDCILGIYHSLSWDKYKDRLVVDLKTNGKKRLVVATTALSMGVNFPDIRYVINWGPARNLLDHHQEAGRAGRDHKQSDVIIIYNGQQLKDCEEDVKDFVKAAKSPAKCLRVASYKSFDPDIQPLEPKHDCCSVCRALCNCQGLESCESAKLPFEEEKQTTAQIEQRRVRSVTDDTKSTLYDALLELRESQCTGGGVLFDKTESHGFSLELCQDIVNRCTEIFTIEDLMTSFPVFTLSHGLKILEVFQEIFSDIEDIPCISTRNSEHCEQVNDYYGYFDFSSDSDSELQDCED